jgi:subtilisin-like proprotein convertase family protein
VTVLTPVLAVNQPIPDNTPAGITSTITTPANLVVERAEIVLNAPHARLGDLRVELISPSGTVSVLADTRSDYSAGYTNYTLSSVRCWGERARGAWTLRVSDTEAGSTGTLASWQLRLIGARSRCLGDWDNSSDGAAATIDDLFLFLNDWFLGLADFDNSGSQTIDDLFLYLGAYFQPCP